MLRATHRPDPASGAVHRPPHPTLGLYDANTPERFWRFAREPSADCWQAAIDAAAGLLPPGAADVLARADWPGLMEHVLGEGQFGPDRYQLSRAKRAYYRVRSVTPRRLTAMARRGLALRARNSFRLGWPIEDRYVRFMHEVGQQAARGADGHRPAPLWPDGADYAFVLTHDVERAAGYDFVRALADLDERYGFHSCFNFVLEDYTLERGLVDELVGRGFEVGIHGLRHDGSLFSSWDRFVRDADRIAAYGRALELVGFRSPATHRNPAWMQRLEIDYDSSFFDTDPFEVMPGGTMSIWPFFCGRFVELPYTLPQDHTLLVLLEQRTPRLWLEKVDFIARWGGMALLIAHPDFLVSSAYRGVYEEFLQEMQLRLKSAPVMWPALPREVARWWRARAG